MTCSIEACDRAVSARGWCKKHYSRWQRRGGDPAIARLDLTRTVGERMWSRVIQDGDCWIWTGSQDQDGYGRISIKNKPELVHRVAYELMVADIPEGLDHDHLCRRTLCCNPYHMEPVTPAINRSRANRDRSRERRELISA